ncbi:FkbM family methyltransferase [Empedobacter falsenii]
MKNYLQKRIKYSKLKSKIGLDFNSYNKLSSYSRNDYIDGEVILFGNKIKFSSPFWFLHSLEEIFVEEVYKFLPNDNNNLIIDCGANIGLSAIYLKKLFPKSKIIALEPDNKVFNQMKFNIDSFGYNKDVEMLESAAWINNEDLTFVSEGSVGGRIKEEQEVASNIITVKAIQLKEIIENQNIFFLKIDIEGAEYEVLKDIKDNLKNVENLFIEFHVKEEEENKLDEILKWVIEAGFSYYLKEAWNNMNYPFTKEINDKYGYQMQLNISCYRK